MTDQDFLRLAIEEGKKGPAKYPFGAVIVKDNEVLASEYRRVEENNDPSLHAEVCAIANACKKLGTKNLPSGCMLYASHEPCLMCFVCAAWAEIDRVVFNTPASDEGSTYEFKDVNIFEINQKLLRPVKVERIELS